MRGARGLAAALVLAACVDDVELASVPATTDAAASSDAARPLDAPLEAAVDGAGDAARPDAPSSLAVQAIVTAISEGDTSREWQSTIEVNVTRAGAPVAGAQVMWITALGSESLSFSIGRYRGSQSGYASWHELAVTTPDERATSQQWAWLPPHAFSSPRVDEVHAPLTPLALAWAPWGAAEAQFTTPATLPAMADTGSATLAGMYFPREEHSVTVRLRRRATTELTGFASGSSVRIDVTASVRVTAP